MNQEIKTQQVAALRSGEYKQPVPHKHAALIKAWADGAAIQWRHGPAYICQASLENPRWDEGVEYRIRPTPKPNVVTWHAVYHDGYGGRHHDREAAESFDPEAILRIEIDRNDPANPVLVSATLEKL